jgi:tetratricopeptide (TPR) repeat protein
MPPANANDTHEGIAAYEQEDFEQASSTSPTPSSMPRKSPKCFTMSPMLTIKPATSMPLSSITARLWKPTTRDLKQKAHYNLGNAEFRRGNAKEAIGHYEAALSIDPG